MKVYLDLDYKEGQFYQHSKTEEQGTVKHESSTGKVSYRRYFNNVEGKLSNFNIADGNFGRELRWTLYGEDTYYFSSPMYDQKGDISQVTTSVIKQIQSLDKDKKYEVSFWNFVGDDGRKRAGITFKHDGEKVEKIDPKELPRWEKKRRAGKDVWDRSEYDDKLYSIVEKEVERLAYTESKSTPEPSTSNDDLPF